LIAAGLASGIAVARVGTFGGTTVTLGPDSAPMADLSDLYRSAFAATLNL
jgi:phosphoribosylformylglycinamidine synthase subunit PurL